MEARELAPTALRVLGAWTHRDTVDSADVTILRTHALSGEADLPVDELACRIINRECARVIQESRVDREAIESNDIPRRKKVG
jgi:hypothetical protein